MARLLGIDPSVVLVDVHLLSFPDCVANSLLLLLCQIFLAMSLQLGKDIALDVVDSLLVVLRVVWIQWYLGDTIFGQLINMDIVHSHHLWLGLGLRLNEVVAIG